MGCIETLHQPVAMSRAYPYDPVILLTVMNGPITQPAHRSGTRGGTRGLGQHKNAASFDTFVASVHNITTRQFEASQSYLRHTHSGERFGSWCVMGMALSGECGQGVRVGDSGVEGDLAAGVDRPQCQQGVSRRLHGPRRVHRQHVPL